MDAFFNTRLALLLSLTALAAINDLFTRKIPNVLLGTFAILGIIAWNLAQGLGGVWTFFGSAGLILFCLSPLFMLRALGGGDIKLFAVIAGTAGLQLFIPIFLLSHIFGGFFGIFYSLCQSLTKTRIGEAISFGKWVTNPFEMGDAVILDNGRFPFALSIFLGTFSAILYETDLMVEWASFLGLK
jgi:prepilin peptidase CpaA